jgi:hypothetical protein
VKLNSILDKRLNDLENNSNKTKQLEDEVVFLKKFSEQLKYLSSSSAPANADPIVTISSSLKLDNLDVSRNVKKSRPSTSGDEKDIEKDDFDESRKSTPNKKRVKTFYSDSRPKTGISSSIKKKQKTNSPPKNSKLNSEVVEKMVLPRIQKRETSVLPEQSSANSLIGKYKNARVSTYLCDKFAIQPDFGVWCGMIIRNQLPFSKSTEFGLKICYFYIILLYSTTSDKVAGSLAFVSPPSPSSTSYLATPLLTTPVVVLFRSRSINVKDSSSDSGFKQTFSRNTSLSSNNSVSRSFDILFIKYE